MKAKGIRFILAGLAAALALSPAVAQAQSPVAMVVMYEVNEGLAFFKGMKGATGPGDFRQRVARASLLGRDVRPLGAASPFAIGSFTTGVGPAPGIVLLQGSLDSTFASVAVGAGGVGGAGGTTFAPGTPNTVARLCLPSCSWVNRFTPSGVTAAYRARSLFR